MPGSVNLGQVFQVHARQQGERCALKDRHRRFSYAQVQERVGNLGRSLRAMGLSKGDRIGILLENAIEFVELYLACAQTGVVAVPINFMLVADEVKYVLNHSEVKALVVAEEFLPLIESLRGELPGIPPSGYIVVGDAPGKDYRRYDDLLKNEAELPPVSMSGADPWIMLYTSGTTGTPKGVIRSHDSYTWFYLINAVEFQFDRYDTAMNVMPLFHVNSTFYTLNLLYVGGAAYIHPARRFMAGELLDVVEKEKITFISLIPTHYQLILDLPDEERSRYDLGSLKKLLCSSAPARKETKLAIMKLFPKVKLFEAYGSTEAGIVTILRPEEQIEKLGSIGREAVGTDVIKLLDSDGRPVPQGRVGEIYSRSPMLFDEYFKMPQKTKEAFRDEWFSASDMGRQDADGYYYIVDRKDNMIITGGEKAFPKEIEAVLACHDGVFDVAVIGTPDRKWGEVVTAVVVLRSGVTLDEKELLCYCKGRLGKFKCPKRVIFIEASMMPRTVTGKILHRELKKRYGSRD